MSNDTHLPASTAGTPALVPSTDPISAELQRYDEHLRDVQGLSLGTRKGYLRVAGRLLRQHLGGDRLDFAKLQPSDIREFLASGLSVRRTPSHARTVAGGLRSYLHYRSTRGDSVGALTAVIASPAHWTLAHLPRALTREEVARLLDECTAVRRWPKRGYAIVRCALWDSLLAGFATFVADRHHDGPQTVELMVAWAQQAKGGQGTRETWYRRMANLRPFLRYLQQFEPQTEIPEDTLFGPEPGRLAPHIYREEEIVELLAATHAAACARRPSRPCLA